jgi:hypothetical protein
VHGKSNFGAFSDKKVAVLAFASCIRQVFRLNSGTS